MFFFSGGLICQVGWGKMQSSGANKIKNLLELRQAGPCGILSPEKVRILAILNLLSFRRFLGAEIWNTGPDLNLAALSLVNKIFSYLPLFECLF